MGDTTGEMGPPCVWGLECTGDQHGVCIYLGSLESCTLLARGLVCLERLHVFGDRRAFGGSACTEGSVCVGDLCLGIWVFEELCGFGESACIVDFMFWGILYAGATCVG